MSLLYLLQHFGGFSNKSQSLKFAGKILVSASHYITIGLLIGYLRGTKGSYASHCFCLNLPTGNI